ncbi:hypothetical protein K432DRAFT_377348 [Lepidopterella palustris CBS 459.81]|uniref:Uncharacterized protein n=1 Tax=Lepidopterella palustris CBS 459.81 TaxID=1314670 RepID=A0A8E2EL70_9PEZI|nr:hypothetical protein K432DRAFT_377348 [Lepidopterella palustris CBS 459.81]
MTLDSVPTSANKTDAAAFNIYGAVRGNNAAFGDPGGYMFHFYEVVPKFLTYTWGAP